MVPGQNRFITVFFYLTDVERGGETAFPFANGDDRPVGSHSLLWSLVSFVFRLVTAP